jgi:hypothetical protein
MYKTALTYGGSLPVVTSDSTDQIVGGNALGFIAGATGTLTYIDPTGQTCLLSVVTAGVVYPISVKRFKATGTSATGLVALF